MLVFGFVFVQGEIHAWSLHDEWFAVTTPVLWAAFVHILSFSRFKYHHIGTGASWLFIVIGGKVSHGSRTERVFVMRHEMIYHENRKSTSIYLIRVI